MYSLLLLLLLRPVGGLVGRGRSFYYRSSLPPTLLSASTSSFSPDRDAALSALAAVLPGRTTNVSRLAALAPRLLEVPADDAWATLDRHTRAGRTERRRHDAVLELLRATLAAAFPSAEVLVDTPLAALPMAAQATKKSRRVDLVLVHRRREEEKGRGARGATAEASSGGDSEAVVEVRLVEVTSVRDDNLPARIAEKRAKYADLPAVLMGSSDGGRGENCRVVARPADVVAIGVFGTVPADTVASLEDIFSLGSSGGSGSGGGSSSSNHNGGRALRRGSATGVARRRRRGGLGEVDAVAMEIAGAASPRESAERLVEELRDIVLRHNLEPFLDEPVDDRRRGPSSYLKRRRRGNLNQRKEKQQRRGSSREKREEEEGGASSTR